MRDILHKVHIFHKVQMFLIVHLILMGLACRVAYDDARDLDVWVAD
jgi:hypothetical protein